MEEVMKDLTKTSNEELVSLLRKNENHAGYAPYPEEYSEKVDELQIELLYRLNRLKELEGENIQCPACASIFKHSDIIRGKNIVHGNDVSSRLRELEAENERHKRMYNLLFGTYKELEQENKKLYELINLSTKHEELWRTRYEESVITIDRLREEIDK
jgi:uncharacterized C2H2 Zn-finger protein